MRFRFSFPAAATFCLAARHRRLQLAIRRRHDREQRRRAHSRVRCADERPDARSRRFRLPRRIQLGRRERRLRSRAHLGWSRQHRLAVRRQLGAHEVVEHAAQRISIFRARRERGRASESRHQQSRQARRRRSSRHARHRSDRRTITRNDSRAKAHIGLISSKLEPASVRSSTATRRFSKRISAAASENIRSGSPATARRARAFRADGRTGSSGNIRTAAGRSTTTSSTARLRN